MGSWSWSRSQSLWPAAAPPEVSKTSRARPPRPARRPASAPPCARSRSAGSGPCPTTQGAGPRPAADRPGRHRSCPRPLPARRPGPLPAAGAQRRRRRADHRPAGARLSVHPSLGAVAPTPPGQQTLIDVAYRQRSMRFSKSLRCWASYASMSSLWRSSRARRALSSLVRNDELARRLGVSCARRGTPMRASLTMLAGRMPTAACAGSASTCAWARGEKAGCRSFDRALAHSSGRDRSRCHAARSRATSACHREGAPRSRPQRPERT